MEMVTGCDGCGLRLTEPVFPWRRHRCADMQSRPMGGSGYEGISEAALIHGDVKIGPGTSICGPADINGKDSVLRIGAACDIASFVTITCADSHRRCVGLSEEIDRRPILIEHNVFIGQGAVILGGARIGHHSVIGAGVVLRKGTLIPPYSRVLSPEPLIQPGFYSDDTTTSTYAMWRKHRADSDR